MSEVRDFGSGPIGPPLQHIIETDVKGEVSLYDPRHERVLVLNGTASDVWLLCDGDQSFDRIVELIAAAYGSQPDSIRNDVAGTVAEFIDAGFLPEPNSESPPGE